MTRRIIRALVLAALFSLMNGEKLFATPPASRKVSHHHENENMSMAQQGVRYRCAKPIIGALERLRSSRTPGLGFGR